MSIDDRVRFLMRVATRAQGEGDLRVARNFQRMAEDARPAEGEGASGAAGRERSA